MAAGGFVADPVALTMVLVMCTASTGNAVASRAGPDASEGSLKSENPKPHNTAQIKAIAIRCVLGKSKDIS